MFLVVSHYFNPNIFKYSEKEEILNSDSLVDKNLDYSKSFGINDV